MPPAELVEDGLRPSRDAENDALVNEIATQATGDDAA
jgi:hypothetical protein